MEGALSLEEFKQGAKLFPNMSENSLVLAREVLVKGKPIHDIVAETGASRQNVHFWAKQIYDALVPVGWVSEKVTLPRAMMTQVLRMQDQERAKLMESRAAR
jgi:TrfB plasmid transcriptional repressor